MKRVEIDTLIRGLADYRARHRCRKALMEAGDAAAPPLLALLEDEEAPTNARWAAMNLLSEMQCKEAIPLLEKIAETNRNLLPDAQRAMETLTGETFTQSTLEFASPEELGVGEVGEIGDDIDLDDEPDATADLFAFVQTAMNEDASEITWEEAGYAHLRVDLPRDRKQQVLIMPADADHLGRERLCIYTECGEATAEAEAVIYQHNVTAHVGNFSVEEQDGQRKVLMRHYEQAVGLSAERMREIVTAIAQAADALEYELTGEDRI